MNQLTRQKRRAFSIIEFFAVSAIVGIIAAIVVPRVVVDDKLAKEKIRDHYAAAINVAVEKYRTERQTWPASIADLSQDPEFFPDGLPSDPLTGRPFELDATTHRVK
jgi:type II secretory pathway pseudopilin PulG